MTKDTKKNYLLETECGKFLHKDEFSLVDNLSEARVKFLTNKEAESWLFDTQSLSEELDNDASRNCRKPDFWSFKLREVTV